MLYIIYIFSTYSLAMRRLGLSLDSLSNVTAVSSFCKTVSRHFDNDCCIDDCLCMMRCWIECRCGMMKGHKVETKCM